MFLPNSTPSKTRHDGSRTRTSPIPATKNNKDRQQVILKFVVTYTVHSIVIHSLILIAILMVILIVIVIAILMVILIVIVIV